MSICSWFGKNFCTVASAIQGLALSLSRTAAASRNSKEDRPVTPPVARISSCVSCLRPLIATAVMRKPAALARALRVSDKAALTSWACPPLTMPSHTLPNSKATVATVPSRRGRYCSTSSIRCGGASRSTSATGAACPVARSLPIDRRCFVPPRENLTRGRRAETYSRSRIAAPRAAAFRSACGLCDRARRPAPSIARAHQLLRPANTSRTHAHGLGPPDTGDHRDAVRHDSSTRQPSTTEAPALTFGRPGKQKVKSVPGDDFFLRFMRTLPEILKHFTGYRNHRGTPDRVPPEAPIERL